MCLIHRFQNYPSLVKVKRMLKGLGCGAGHKGNTELGITNGRERTIQKTNKKDNARGEELSNMEARGLDSGHLKGCGSGIVWNRGHCGQVDGLEVGS